jgi:hypothetical protein
MTPAIIRPAQPYRLQRPGVRLAWAVHDSVEEQTHTIELSRFESRSDDLGDQLAGAFGFERENESQERLEVLVPLLCVCREPGQAPPDDPQSFRC